MVSATAPFSVVASTVSQLDTAPSVGINTGGSQFPYPQYVPVSVPSQIPGAEARITNINAPQNVLPASTFNIIVTFKIMQITASTPNADFKVHLSIPQLTLEHDSPKQTLSNLAVGSALFTVTLPLPGPGSFGLITGTVSLINVNTGNTDDSAAISITVLGGEETESPDHHFPPVGVTTGPFPPVAVVTGPSQIGLPSPTGFDAVILTSETDDDLGIESHGHEPNEDVDFDLDIPLINAHVSFTEKADKDGTAHHHHKIHKPDKSKHFPTSIHSKGKHSRKEGHRVVDI